jgi:uncharacterized membrane protein YczE
MINFGARLLNMMLGLVLYALGIVMTINANVGYAPWEVFHVGLAETTGLTLGVASIIAGVVIVIIVTALGEKAGLGTIASMILTGVLIDVIVILNVIPASGNLAVGIIMLAAGMFIIALGSYFYMKAAFGAGPRDNLMVVLTRKTKIPVGVCRLLVELLVTLIGWLLGGMVGIGTVVSFIGIGVCVQIVFSLCKFDVTAVKHETLRETFSRMFRGK